VFYNGVQLGDILAFGFGLNDAGGNHSAGSPVKCIVRRAGGGAGDAAIASTDATHLTHANLPVGLYEYVFSVSADTYSVSAGENYLVYAYASASGLSTVACVGGFRLAAIAANVVRVDNASATAALSAISYTAALSALRSIPVLSAQAVSVIAAQALADYDVPTSADVSALVSTIGYIANLSALRNVGVLSAAAASVVVAGALADYDVPTSADVSVIVNASWKITTLAEPTDVPAWASATPANLLAWMGMLATNRMVQTSTAT
jgi:hypothetical protein